MLLILINIITIMDVINISIIGRNYKTILFLFVLLIIFKNKLFYLNNIQKLYNIKHYHCELLNYVAIFKFPTLAPSLKIIVSSK